MHRILARVIALLMLPLLAGCTISKTTALESPSAPQSWATSDLLDLAAKANFRATQTNVPTSLSSKDVVELLGRSGDVTKDPPPDATIVTVKAQISEGPDDGRIVWVVGVYPVEMPLLRGLRSTATPPPDERAIGREVNVFDATTGEHLGTLIAGGEPGLGLRPNPGIETDGAR